MTFQLLPIADIMASVKMVHNEPGKVPSKEASQEPCPTFGPCPNTQVANFRFQQEAVHLPFKLNPGDVPLEKNARPNLMT